MLLPSLRASVLVLGVFGCPGCRATDQGTAPSVSSPLNLSFSPGDYFSYTTWDLDEFGETVESTRSRTSWTVADTGRLVRGFTGVAVILDSVFRRSTVNTDSLAHVDSMFVKVASNGDILQYGFLAALLRKRENIDLPPQWDRIAAFSLPGGSSWVIGQGDTAGTTTVTGIIAADQEYVGVVVNGVQRVLLAYRVEITKPDLEFDFWITDLPLGFLRLVDQSTFLANGTLQELTTVGETVPNL